MTTFIKTKFNKSGDQTNIDNINKYYITVAANIKEFQNNLPKFMEKRRWTYGLFGQNYGVAVFYIVPN